MSKLYRTIKNWIFSIFKQKETHYRFSFTEDMPEKISPMKLYFIGEYQNYWQVVMLCPCGCGSPLHMNLLEEYFPYWEYKIEDGKVSLFPSIDRFVGCKSHFHLIKGKIIWH
ncbi:hypothetical protein FE904_00120 [Chryseobacterium indologenes]|uniref:DUF6527 family protein n=1 Tax=Chryseobacterium indologenes TaxID=253 RepID=UPI001108B455|nr:DUF6527 family protein [Chryseobacterium indologenes]TLX27435.1 hypothetical protein FE904_00120 [Chryseobacterium indologenes]